MTKWDEVKNQYMKETGELRNLWKLNNTLLNNEWMKEKRNHQRNQKSLETNENTAYQSLQDTAKSVLGEKFIAINVYIRKRMLQVKN